MTKHSLKLTAPHARALNKHSHSALFAIFIASSIWQSGVEANCSLASTTPANITFNNNSTTAVDVSWVDSSCIEKAMTSVQPGSSVTQPSWKGHVWRTRKISDHSLLTETQIVTDPVKVNVVEPILPTATTLTSTTTKTTTTATTGATVLAAAATALPASPPNTPFVDPMPVPPIMTPLSGLNPSPTQSVDALSPKIVPSPRVITTAPLRVSSINPSTKLLQFINQSVSVPIGNFTEANRADHQKWTQFGGTSSTTAGFTGAMYESVEMEVPWNFYPEVDKVPSSYVWTFVEANTGIVGPFRINAQYGVPVLHRIHNALPANNGGFGINQTSTHLHNGHTASESDGGPVQFYDAGQFKDFHYANVRAGFTKKDSLGNISNVYSTFNGKQVLGDVNETLGFLWFHDHRFDFTAQNVYKGLVSFYTLFSNDILLDTGDETTGLQLPSGAYDVPMIFGDKRFDPTTGLLSFDTGNVDGVLGDKFTVNGKIQPYFNVQKRKYRFRLLDGGPSRYYEFFLSNAASFVQLSTNGNLLPAPITTKSIRLGVAERTDVIVDFTNVAAGTKIYLQNKLEQLDGRGPTGKILTTPTNLVEFRVQPLAAGVKTFPDASKIPAAATTAKPVTMLPLPNKNAPVVLSRKYDFGSSNGAWTVNGQFFDPNTIIAFPNMNTAEKWTLTSGGGWSHPVHIHHEEFQLLSRNGSTALIADDVGRKDVVRIGQAAQGTVGTSTLDWFMQFRDWSGDYPVHCHNVVHEDHAMMMRFMIMP